MKPSTAPPIPETIQLRINGHFFGSIIPYIAGSVTPATAEMNAAGDKPLIFLSLVFSQIAPTVPLFANVVPNIAAKIISPPCVMFIIAIGTNDQCKPNITSTGQNVPTMAHMIIGFTAYSQLNANDNPLEIIDATGPMINMVSANVTVVVINGIAKSLIVSGMCFLNLFSNHPAKATAHITGITELV